MTANKDIRTRAAKKGVYLWEIADKIGLCDSSFSRKLRKELPTAEKKRIFSIIDEIAAKKKNAANGATNTN